jgi:hypothetical protein
MPTDWIKHSAEVQHSKKLLKALGTKEDVQRIIRPVKMIVVLKASLFIVHDVE